jgi:hypothetical protein
MVILINNYEENKHDILMKFSFYVFKINITSISKLKTTLNGSTSTKD